MSSGKALNTAHPLYNNIVRALSPDNALPKLVAFDGGSDTALQSWNYVKSIPEPTATWTAVQGFAKTPTAGFWFAIDTASIRKYDLNNNKLFTQSLPYVGLPAGVDHLGDGFADDQFLYVAYSNYNAGSSTQMGVAKYNVSDLSLDSYIDLKTHTNLNASSCCLDKTGTEILVTSFFVTAGADNRNTDIYRISKSTELFLGIAKLKTPSVGIQSMAYSAFHDCYFIGSHDIPNGKDAAYQYTATLVLITIIDPIDSSDEFEGVEAVGDDVLFNAIGGSPRKIDFDDGLIITNNTANSQPVQFLDASLMTDNITILMEIEPLSLFNYNSVMDNETYGNEWESWIYSDGRLAWRVDTSNSIITPIGTIVAGQKYILAFTWSKSGSIVTTKLGVNGVYVGSTTGTWKTPPTTGMWLAGKNASNDQGSHVYGGIPVFNKVLSDTELLDASNNFSDFYLSSAQEDIVASLSLSNQTTISIKTQKLAASKLSLQANNSIMLYGQKLAVTSLSTTNLATVNINASKVSIESHSAVLSLTNLTTVTIAAQKQAASSLNLTNVNNVNVVSKKLASAEFHLQNYATTIITKYSESYIPVVRRICISASINNTLIIKGCF